MGTELYTTKCPNCSQTANVEERLSSNDLTIDCPSCGYYKHRDGQFPENNVERIVFAQIWHGMHVMPIHYDGKTPFADLVASGKQLQKILKAQ